MMSGKSLNAKNNNAGFSLVELIIVIAIMAVLIGIVGSQVIPYLNNARKARDIQILSAFATASVAAYSEKALTVSEDAESLEIVVVPSENGDVYTCEASDAVAQKTKFLVGSDYITNANGSFKNKEFQKANKLIISFDFVEKKVNVELYDGDNCLTELDDIGARL